MNAVEPHQNPQITNEHEHASLKANLKLAFKLLQRDWRGGNLSILVFSLLLAIATVTSISLFTSRIHNSIYAEAAQFIAGDIKISGSQAIETRWIEQAEELGLESSSLTEFASMAFAGEDMTLTSVKAVTPGYPLKGELIIADQPFTAGNVVKHGPLPGEAWLAPRLFDALNIAVGDTIFIGDGEFKATAALNKEPDSGQSLFGVSPRVMISASDIASTNAVQVGSRIKYSLLLAGAPDALSQFNEWVEPKLGHHFRLNDIKTSSRSVGETLERAEGFLLLAGSLSVILGGAAIALAARRYAKKHHQTVALLKTLGSSPNDMTVIFGAILLGLGLIAIIVGNLLGWGLHWGILLAIGNLLSSELAAPSFAAYWTGSLTGFVALLAFAAPPLFALRTVSPAAALNEGNSTPLSLFWTNAIGISAVIGLVYYYSMDISLTLFLTLGLLVALVGVFCLSWLTINLTKRLAGKLGHTWRMGLNNLNRHRQTNALQIMIFAIILLLIAIIIAVRSHLIQQWQNQIPEGTANHFAFNIYLDELPAIKDKFAQANIKHSDFFPMTRGRVVGVNSLSAADLVKQHSKGRMNYEREINLTTSNNLSEDNTIISGTWWPDIVKNYPEEMLVSVEEDYAKGLNIDIDDIVELSIAGQTLKARVTSIRKVQWDSMNPNFFMIFDQPIDQQFGANWLTSFYLSDEQKTFINRLSKAHPTISIIELDQTIEQIKSIVNKITTAVEFILALVLISGILVLITSIQATLDMRFKESAILRTLGAERSLVSKTLLVEFATLGLLAGILSVLGTEASLYMLQTKTFNMDYAPFQIMWILLPLSSGILIATAGWLSTKKVFNIPPMTVLKSI